MLRRDFIRFASFAAGTSPFLKVAALDTNTAYTFADVRQEDPKSVSAAELQSLFLAPPTRYRPMVRWWWNGDRVTSDEVTREIEVLQGAGIGGVEINPIKFPSQADPSNTETLTWMSDEWIAVLKTALKETKERGMTCDMIVGSGWPYGGEFLARADQIQMMALGTREFSGPKSVQLSSSELLADVHPRFVSPYKDPLKELSTITLVPYEMDGVASATPIPVTAENKIVTFDVPPGRHILYFLVKLTGYMAVINGAPGASGPVLNHYSASSVRRYLDRISDRLSAQLGPLGDHFRAFFTDSIELEGENWCDDMLLEFRRKRGYDLAPYLPFVLFKIGEMGNAIAAPYGANLSLEFEKQTQLVRYDFETTKQELFQERFVATFAAWCKRVGVRSRMQAYGMDCDPITAGMMVDIPECETWIRTERILPFGDGDYRNGRSYTMINKFVSSAAHLSGKQLISCEEMTNTDDPFHTSLERIKVAGDQSILSGVTQSVLHGFNYSPISAPFPGWVRYGTYFSEHNTWWPYFKLWVDYKARLSMLFQHAEMQADIAILPPRADLASKYGFQRDPFPRIAYPGYIYKIWEAVHQNGAGCDYLNEEILRKSTVQDGRLIFQSRSYRALLLPEVESLSLSTAKKLYEFVSSGGVVLFLGKTPHLSAGLAQQQADSAEVLRLVSKMRADYPDRTPLESVNEKNMVGWYRDLQRKYSLIPSVSISHPTDFMSQIHYRNGEQDIFFFSHYGAEESVTFEARFRTGSKEAWLWNPESGTCSRLAKKDNALTISLGPSESKLIVFEPRSHRVEKRSGTLPLLEHAAYASSPGHTIVGPWLVKLESVDGTITSIQIPELIDLNQRNLGSFAGTIVYRKDLEIHGKSPRWLILARIHAVTEVEINGESLGVRWYGEHCYDVRGKMHLGENQISIKVVTTLGSYLKTLKGNPTAQVWTANTPTYPLGLLGPVKLIR